MSMHHDPELDDVLQDQELRRLGELLGTSRYAEPPMDEAFRSGLRRQLMQTAWEMTEGGPSWWKRAFAPPGLAWVGATAGLLLIASVVIYMVSQPAGGFNQIIVNSPIDGNHGVALQQPILVAFNQPMDHPKTEAAVQVTPATNVTFSWSANNLYVQPTSGNLAPNTQYQVTIGPTAQTASGQPLATAQTITFVTQPPAPPSPSPASSPTPRASVAPGSLVAGERQLAPLGGAITAPVQWSADSSTVYFVGANGALDVVPASGGDVKVVAPDGVSSPSIAPAGDRIAYVRGGKVEVLTFAAGTTTELVGTPAATLVGWAKDKPVWAAADGIYSQDAGGPAQLAPLPASGHVTVLSVAPDGSHAVYTRDQDLFVLDLATAKSTQLGGAGASFAGWSPDGSQLLVTSGDKLAVSDLQGNSQATLSGGETSWSSQDSILLGSATDLYQVRPDGSNLTKLANGTYHAPAWAPNGTIFTFFRGGAIWSASAPALPPQPTALDQATAVVSAFMQARQKLQADQAASYLDDNGKQAYAAGGLNLVISGDPRFSRFYILTQVLSGTQPDTATFTVRIVLTHGKLDVGEFDETLTLIRGATTRQFLIDQATAGAHRDLGKGAEVVGVEVAADTVKITFDSDLDPGTVSGGVHLLDSRGKAVDGTVTYANRTVTITGLDLKAGVQYKLVVLTTLRDVLGHNVAPEYDLNIIGPVLKNHGNQKATGVVSASPSPVPASTSTSPTALPAN
ncbi:MAG: Ig-like domain-containing protein [Candidatus Dormiibacterota bacterium]